VKSIPSALATHYALGSTTCAYGMRITRTDDEVYAFTSHDVSDTIDAIEYVADGLNVTNIVIAADLAVGNLELRTLHDGTVFSTVDIFNGVWHNAEFEIFRYNWASLGDGVETLLTGTLGELEILQNEVMCELRDIRQAIQQPVEVLSSKTCRARLGDDLCAKDLTAFTHTGTLTGVTSNQVFRDSSRGEAANYFDEGELHFTSGPNAGVRRKIKSYAANGTFTLALPLFGTVAIGHTYSAIAGCRKRLEEDCLTKFNNVVNFQGEPHRRGVNNLTAAPDVSV
jgi:uncharacterized phage protein (TIGR02218 family)